jgi:hypothetical protein
LLGLLILLNCPVRCSKLEAHVDLQFNDLGGLRQLLQCCQGLLQMINGFSNGGSTQCALAGQSGVVGSLLPELATLRMLRKSLDVLVLAVCVGALDGVYDAGM